MSFLIVMVLLLVVMYVLMIRPQRQRQQQQQSMIEGASVGDDVLTTGGIYGTVVEAEGDDLVVEIADGMNVHMTRRGVAAVLPPESEEARGGRRARRRRSRSRPPRSMKVPLPQTKKQLRTRWLQRASPPIATSLSHRP